MARRTSQSHREYLASSQWKMRREEHFLKPWNQRCSECDLPRWLSKLIYGQDLHVHHVTYNFVGDVDKSDLQTLCPYHHDVETHGRSELAEVKGHACKSCQTTVFDPRADYCDVCRVLSDSDSLFHYLSQDNMEMDVALVAIGHAFRVQKGLTRLYFEKSKGLGQ